MLVKELIDQVGEYITTPWPASYLSQALFIYIDDDDTVVDRPWHRGPKTRIVDEVIQPVKCTEFQYA